MRLQTSPKHSCLFSWFFDSQLTSRENMSFQRRLKLLKAQNSHILSSRNMWRRDWLLYMPLILRADCFGELDYSSMKIKSWWCAYPVPTPLYDHWRTARLCSLGHHCQSGPGISSPWRVDHTSKLPPFEIRIHCHVIIASTTCCWNLFGTRNS